MRLVCTARAVAAGVCGARTHACSVHTRVNAFSPPPISTRPCIFLGSANQPGLHRIFLNVSRDPLPLANVAHATVVRFPLPERFARSPQYSVRLSRRDALKRLQQQARRRQRLQQHVHMVRHNHKRAWIVLPQVGSFENGSNHQFRNAFLPQEHGTGSRMVEISIHPNEGLSAREFSRRRVSGMGKAPMQVPTNKEPVVGRVDVRQPSSRIHYLDSASPFAKISNIHTFRDTRNPNRTNTRHLSCGACTHACSVHTRVNASAPYLRTPGIPQRRCAHSPLSSHHPTNISRSHECERCTHECVRHSRPDKPAGMKLRQGLVTSHEHLRTLYPQAHRDHAAHRRHRAGRRRGVPGSAGFAFAAGGFSDHLGEREPCRARVRRPWRLRWPRRSSGSSAASPSVTEMTSSSASGLEQHHAAIRLEPQHRRGGARRTGRHRRGARLSAHQSAEQSHIPQGQSGGFAHLHAGAHLQGARQGPDVRCRVHHHGAETGAGPRRGTGDAWEAARCPACASS